MPSRTLATWCHDVELQQKLSARRVPSIAPPSRCPESSTWSARARGVTARAATATAAAIADMLACARPALRGRSPSRAGWGGAHLTKLRCTPRLRCTPAQVRQMYTPYGTDDQVGFFAGQSKQTWAQAVGGDSSGSWARSTLGDAGRATAQQGKPARAAKPTNDTGLQPEANPPGRPQARAPRLRSPAAGGCVGCAARAGLAEPRRALDVARGGPHTLFSSLPRSFLNSASRSSLPAAAIAACARAPRDAPAEVAAGPCAPCHSAQPTQPVCLRQQTCDRWRGSPESSSTGGEEKGRPANRVKGRGRSQLQRCFKVAGSSP